MKNLKTNYKTIIFSIMMSLTLFAFACGEDDENNPGSETTGNYIWEKFVFHNAPGYDYCWFTDDDIVSAYTTNIYKGDDIIRQVTYNGTGPNDNWFDDDDEVLSYADFEFENENSNFHSKATTYNSGANGNWFDSDDEMTSYEVREFDSQEMWTRSTTYNNIDEKIGCIKYTYKSDGTFDKWIYYDCVDGVCFDSNDVIVFYMAFLPYGKQFDKFVSVWDPGNDGEWLTEDDVWEEYADFIYVLDE